MRASSWPPPRARARRRRRRGGPPPGATAQRSSTAASTQASRDEERGGDSEDREQVEPTRRPGRARPRACAVVPGWSARAPARLRRGIRQISRTATVRRRATRMSMKPLLRDAHPWTLWPAMHAGARRSAPPRRVPSHGIGRVRRDQPDDVDADPSGSPEPRTAICPPMWSRRHRAVGPALPERAGRLGLSTYATRPWSSIACTIPATRNRTSCPFGSWTASRRRGAGRAPRPARPRPPPRPRAGGGGRRRAAAPRTPGGGAPKTSSVNGSSSANDQQPRGCRTASPPPPRGSCVTLPQLRRPRIDEELVALADAERLLVQVLEHRRDREDREHDGDREADDRDCRGGPGRPREHEPDAEKRQRRGSGSCRPLCPTSPPRSTSTARPPRRAPRGPARRGHDEQRQPERARDEKQCERRRRAAAR